MTAQQIYNTLTRRKEPLRPIEPGKLRIYVCGMTVYDYCHLGHARAFVAFDVITRYLRARGVQLTYVRNITDIDDKILVRARENGEDYRVLTERFIAAMHEDFAALGMLPPDLEPRATAHIAEIRQMIRVLIERGHAYRAANGDVYYRVSSFADYGQLSGKNPEQLLAGARVEVGELKEDPRDFALWKAAVAGEVSWDSPWGPGRPGWHIECSAMSTCALGDNFDIHGGGPDLVFPHHENEIAQSQAATGKHYANVWMHAGPLRIDDEKMSKSLGNFFTIRDVLAAWPAEVVRFFLIASHYRSPINYSVDSLKAAKAALARFYLALRDFADVEPVALPGQPETAYQHRFAAAMDDDFNTPEALAVFYDMVREINSLAAHEPDRAARLVAELKGLAAILGLLGADPVAFLQGSGEGALDNAGIERLIGERAEAKRARDFSRADAIRDRLLQQGIVLEDGRDGTTWRRQK